MMNEARREELLQRIYARTDALLDEAAHSIQEALERYLQRYELRERPPEAERRRGPR